MKNHIGSVFRYLLVALHNLLAGTRALFFLPVRSTAFRFSGDDIVGQIAFGLATIFALGYVTLLRHPSLEFNRSFNADGITLALSAYLVVALGCYLSVRLPGRQHALRPVLVMVFSMAPAVLVAGYALTEAIGSNLINRYWSFIGLAVFFWLAIAAARVLHLACGTRSLALLGSSSLLAALAVAPFMIHGPQPLWYVWKKGPSGPASVHVNIENTYHRQHALLGRALDNVAAGRRGVPEFYFVGFAGWASEDVFMNEARAAADLFRRRFGAKGRTLILVNNPDTIDDMPLASVSNLRDALKGVAQKMNRDEDILFLYVTSHGSAESVGVRHGRLSLNGLSPKTLRRMLDEAGIKNRVLVISACYSGSFIEPLRNENTLIMTASAADRTSFGCGHDGKFTYFGSALIGKALEKNSSFARAFEAATKSIEKREKKEGLTPSKPQISMGKAITPILQHIDEQLGSRP